MKGGSNNFISARELAERLDVSICTIYRNWEAWGLKGVYVGRQLRFRERDIENWIVKLS